MVIFGFVWILIVSSIVMAICGALILGSVILGVQIYEWHTGDEIADMDDDERTY